MARTHHRLDLICVAQPWSRQPDPDAFEACAPRWQAAPEAIIVGGFADLRLDQPRGRVLYSNTMGGVRVRCPQCDQPLAREFAAAVERWKAGEDEPGLQCVGCGRVQALAQVQTRPTTARGLGAVVFADVGSAELAPGAREQIEAVVGDFVVVLRRS